MSHRFSTSKKLATVFFNIPGVGSVHVQQNDASKPSAKLTKAIEKALAVFRKEYYGKDEPNDL